MKIIYNHPNFTLWTGNCKVNKCIGFFIKLSVLGE